MKQIFFAIIGFLALAAMMALLFIGIDERQPEPEIIIPEPIIPEPEPFCGDRTCDPGEDCCLDCGCSDGYSCNTDTNACLMKGNDRVCGDGVCDFGEHVLNCCTDCNYCDQGMHCDKALNRCVADDVGIDRESAKKAFVTFLNDKGYETRGMSWSAKPDTYEGEPVLKVCNVISDEETQVRRLCAQVTKNYQIVGFVRFL